jgi:hypothetical protein
MAPKPKKASTSYSPAPMSAAAKAKAGARGKSQASKVSQKTIDQIKKDGMTKAVAKVKSGTATPAYKMGATRMYGSKRFATPAALKLPEPSLKERYMPSGEDVKKFLKEGGKENLEIAKMLGKAFGAYTKATAQPAIFAAKTVKSIASKKPPRPTRQVGKGAPIKQMYSNKNLKKK